MKTPETIEKQEAAKLAILIRTIYGKKSRCSKVSNDLIAGGLPSKAKGSVHNAKIVHVGLVATKTVNAKKKPERRWYETEVLAEFDGPTSEDAASEFLKLLPTRTRQPSTRCITDGPIVAVKPWKQKPNADSTIIRYI